MNDVMAMGQHDVVGELNYRRSKILLNPTGAYAVQPAGSRLTRCAAVKV